MRLRPLELNDAKQLARWDDPETPYGKQLAIIRKMRDDPRRRDFVMHEGKLVVGWGGIVRYEDHEVLGWLVAPAWRVHGYGTAIALSLLTMCDTEHAVAIIPVMNKPSWRIAKRLGFQPAGFTCGGEMIWHTSLSAMHSSRRALHGLDGLDLHPGTVQAPTS